MAYQRGEIKLTTATLLRAARFPREIEMRELKAQTGRARLADIRRQMARILDIVGEELGPAALDQVYVATRADREIENTLWCDEFAHRRQRHLDLIDDLAAINPPERWDPLSEIRESHRHRRCLTDGDVRRAAKTPSPIPGSADHLTTELVAA